MNGTAQGTFIAGNESESDIAQPAHRFELTPPTYHGLERSEALTRYGNDLVAGAKAHNEHPLRYDVPASEGYNSNRWAASLVIAKGGEAGLADVRRIAERMDGNMPLVGEAPGVKPPWQRGDDLRESENVVHAIDIGAPIAPGFHNASIPRDRFSDGPVHDRAAAYPKPAAGTVDVGEKAVLDDKGVALFRDLGAYARAEIGDAGHGLVHAAASYIARTPEPAPPLEPGSPLTRLPGQPIHVERDGAVREYGAGYAQNGRITNIDGDRVTQHIGRGNVSYSSSELAAQSRDPNATERALRTAYETQTQAAIRFGRDGFISATDLGKEQTRQFGIEAGR